MKRRRRGNDGEDEGGGRLLNPSAGWRSERIKQVKEDKQKQDERMNMRNK